MNENNVFLCGLTLSLIVAMAVGGMYAIKSDEHIKEVILKGNDPLRVMCAFKFDRRMEETCKTLAAQP